MSAAASDEHDEHDECDEKGQRQQQEPPLPLGVAIVEYDDGPLHVAFKCRIPHDPVKAAKKLRVMRAIIQEESGWSSH